MAAAVLACLPWTRGVWRETNERIWRRFSPRYRRSNGRRRRCAHGGGCVMWLRTSSATTNKRAWPAHTRRQEPLSAGPDQRSRAGAIRHAHSRAVAGAADTSPATPRPCACGATSGPRSPNCIPSPSLQPGSVLNGPPRYKHAIRTLQARIILLRCTQSTAEPG